LRTLSNEHTQRRELWTRPVPMQALLRREGNKRRQGHDLTQVLGDYLGRRHRRHRLYLDTEFRQEQMKTILAYLREAKMPRWNAQVAAATGMHRVTTSLLLSFLHGDGKIVRYAYDRTHTNAAYVARQYAHLFEHIPVEALSPIDDLDDMNLYEQLSEVLHEHTAIERSLLHRQFPNVKNTLLDGVMEQFGWRLRALGRRQKYWVSPEHPHFVSIQSGTRDVDAQIKGRRAAYREPQEFEDEDEDLFFEEGEILEPNMAPIDEESPVIVIDEPIVDEPVVATSKPVINGETTTILAFLQTGGMLAPRDIAKGTSLSTRRVNVLLSELVELGKVMKFPMGKTEVYVAR
jgi:hypothetical protein